MVELTDVEQLCLTCPVPFGCNEKDPRCLYHLAAGDERREYKRHVLVLLAENGEMSTQAIAEQSGWRAVEAYKLLDSLRRAGLVRCVGSNKNTSKWRLIHGSDNN